MRINYVLQVPLFLIGLMVWCDGFAQNPSSLLANYKSDRTNGTEPVLPDFSFAGYHYGEDAPPTILPHTVYDVTDPAYGAVANDGQSDKAAIIAAITAAEANGSGVVFFPPGRYLVNEPTDNINEIIYINKSNIVLKGSGSGPGGTTLVQTSYTEQLQPGNFWTCPFLFQFVPASTGSSKITDVTDDAARESFTVQVASTSSISVGQWVMLRLNSDNSTLLNEEFTPHAIDASYTKINTAVTVREFHQVASKTSNTITFKEPIHRAVEADYGWSIHTYKTIEEVGFMDIAYEGKMDFPFVHHRDWKDDSGWSGVQFNQVVNGWITRCKFGNFSQTAQFKLSAYCSALENVYEGNPGHEFISANASTGTVIGLNVDKSTNGIWHSCGVIAEAIGNVLWRNVHPPTGGIELHSSQPRANCIDACIGGFGFHMGGSVGNLPNHLRHLVLWNVDASGSTVSTTPYYEPWEPGTGAGHKIVMPIVSGFVGYDFKPGQTQENESPGVHVDEESLYEHQLAHRLGFTPDWISKSNNFLKSITINGTPLAGFESKKLDYTFITTEVPTITAEARDNLAGVNISYPANAPGMAVINVTAQNGVARAYRVNLEYFSYTETLNNIDSEGWLSKPYTGDHGFTWNLDGRAIDGYLDFHTRSVYFHAGKTGLTSAKIPNGIGSFKVRCLDKWDVGSERKVELLVDGMVRGSMTHNDEARYVFEVNDINIEGEVVIALRNASSTDKNNTIAFDDLQWTRYPANPKSENSFLSGITLDGVPLNGFVKETLEYDIVATTVPVVVATVEDNKAAASVSAAAGVPGITTVTVTAENGAQRVYKLNFRLKSENNYLSAIKLDGVALEGFSKETLSYNVGRANVATVSVITEDNHATVSISQATGVPGTATLTVTAENGADRIYAVSFHIPSDNNYLSQITLNGEALDGFSKETLSYATKQSSVPTILATAEDNKAQVTIDPASGIPGTTTLTVTAESGLQRIYNVNFELASDNNYASVIILDGSVINGFKKTIMEYNVVRTTIPDMTVSLESPQASKSISEAASIPGTTNIIVTAESGAQRIYKINYTLPSDNNYLSSIKLDNELLEGFDKEKSNYTVKKTNVPTVLAETEDANASLAIENPKSVPGNAAITVTAEDGSKRSYTITYELAEILGWDDQVSKREVTLYPNPVSPGQELIVQLRAYGHSKRIELTLVDSWGKVVRKEGFEIPNHQGQASFALPQNIGKGIFFLIVDDLEHPAVSKVIIVR